VVSRRHRLPMPVDFLSAAALPPKNSFPMSLRKAETPTGVTPDTENSSDVPGQFVLQVPPAALGFEIGALKAVPRLEIFASITA